MKHKKGIICFMAMAVFVKWKEMKDKKRDEMLRTENNKLLPVAEPLAGNKK